MLEPIKIIISLRVIIFGGQETGKPWLLPEVYAGIPGLSKPVRWKNWPHMISIGSFLGTVRGSIYL
jgi:hypothetical protein